MHILQTVEGRNLWVGPGGTEHVQCVLALSDEAAPQGCWECSIACAKAVNEVVFECLYGAFSSVDSVIVGLYQLESNVFVLQVSLNCFGRYIIDDVEFWFETAPVEVIHLCFKCLH